MSAKCFRFDINKCVGCHACVVACAIENNTLPETLWRDVTAFNPSGYLEIPLFHISLACNHCDDAPCMKNCPALAYRKDIKLGTIQHYANKCIGCKYCTWACPYDAPKFNERKKIIEKCTFCNHRLEEGLKPACANLCPTGALDYIDRPESIDYHDIPGFTDYGIKPKIRMVSKKKDKPKLVTSEKQEYKIPRKKPNKDSKIKVKQEWPLIAFTLIATILVSIFTAAFLGKVSTEPYLFVTLGFGAMLLSLLHLGKKLRAWRAFLNLKNSWLSREIFFFALFWILSLVYFFVYQHEIIAWTGIAVGIISLISIDKVYKIAIQPTAVEIHSAHVLLSYFLFTALFFEYYRALIFIIIIKAGLYIYRKLHFRKQDKNYRLFVTAWRLDMLISFPFLFWIFGISNLFWWLAISLFIGELIDRIEYYDELDVITPEKEIDED